MILADKLNELLRKASDAVMDDKPEEAKSVIKVVENHLSCYPSTRRLKAKFAVFNVWFSKRIQLIENRDRALDITLPQSIPSRIVAIEDQAHRSKSLEFIPRRKTTYKWAQRDNLLANIGYTGISMEDAIHDLCYHASWLARSGDLHKARLYMHLCEKEIVAAPDNIVTRAVHGKFAKFKSRLESKCNFLELPQKRVSFDPTIKRAPESRYKSIVALREESALTKQVIRSLSK